MTIFIIVSYIITKPIHVDEGWIYSAAHAKNVYGYYTLPAFYDVNPFNQISTLNSGLITQFFRLVDSLFTEPIVAIKMLRIVFFIIWFLAIWIYLKNKNIFKTEWMNILITMLIVSQGVMLQALGTARPEILISALLLLLLWNYERNIELNYKKLILLGLSSLIFFLHPNGIIYLLILILIGADIKAPLRSIIYFTLIGTVILLYYLIFIDTNIPLHSLQYKLMYSTGKEEKFITSLNNLPDYMWREIRDRYFVYGARELISYPLLITSILLPVIAGTFAGFYDRSLRIELIYVIGTIFFFILLGNKVSTYLVYIIPFLIIMVCSLLDKRQYLLIILAALMIIVQSTVAVRGIVWNYEQNKTKNKIISIIQNEVKTGETVYAPFEYAPYLSSQYRYLTTTQKDKNELYKTFNIHPSKCVVIAETGNAIWDFAGQDGKVITQIGNLLIKRIN